MKKGLVLLSPEPDWAEEAIRELAPGAHAIVVGEDFVGVEGRKAGFDVRDTILVLSPGIARIAFVFRKPIEESTTTAQVIKTGTGAMNIDDCRVASGGEHFRFGTIRRLAAGFVDGADARTGKSSGRFAPGYSFEATNHPGGRWPSNLVLVHGPECREVGAKRIQGSHPWPESAREANVHGKETIPLYECQDDCLARALNTQSGTLKSGKVEPHHMRNNTKQINRGGYHGGFGDHPLMGYGDEGGASRFYPQFMNEDELLAWLETLVGVR